MVGFVANQKLLAVHTIRQGNKTTRTSHARPSYIIIIIIIISFLQPIRDPGITISIPQTTRSTLGTVGCTQRQRHAHRTGRMQN
jgi:hypothetical protein